VAVVAVFALGIAGVFVLRAPDSPSEVAEGFEEDGAGRQIRQPSVARSIGEPVFSEGPLAFVATDVAGLADAIAASSVLDEAALVRVNDLRRASTASRDVCLGVSRPTTEEDILDTRAFRIVDNDAVVDVRITEFSEPATVDRVLQAARAAWEACDGTTLEPGGTVERSVLSFVSLSGTPGVNLQSTLLDESGALESTSQTLAIPAGDLLIEVRMISNGELSTSVDPVEILDEVEALI